MRPALSAILCASRICAATPADAPIQADIVIYGGTSSAITAAVQAHRMGRSVVIVCPEAHLGGMTAAGLGWTDSGDKSVIGGLARGFYQSVMQHYDDPAAWTHDDRDRFGGYRATEDAMWVFEPHVAESIFEAMIADAGVPVYRDEWLDREHGVSKHGERITSISTTSGRVFAARVFIDASYEGDLMAAAGVPYTVGRESNAAYNETLNGVQTANARKHQFDVDIDPFVVTGDPASGLLPEIHDGPPGVDGAADHRLQAYCFRLCLTRVHANRVPFPIPDGYDPARYELLLRYLLAGPNLPLAKFDPMPNGKTDTNNNGPFSTDHIGANNDYPDASYARRAEILEDHRRYQQGFFYFLANDPRVPEPVRTSIAAWGLAADEFTDTGNWPNQIYVRESRRMLGDVVTSERHLRGLTPTPDPIGMGSYNMDSHNTQRYVATSDAGRPIVRNEGDVQINPGGPYPIGYSTITPPHGSCPNLLVPVCVSSSHIAYGSIRMEPVFMILGQSAATAAAIAIERDLSVQEVPYAALRDHLIADGQVLARGQPAPGVNPTSLPGTVLDDAEAQRTGDWVTSTSVPGFIGVGYLHNDNKPGPSLRFHATVPTPGRYTIRFAYTPHANRATNVPVTVTADAAVPRGATSTHVNERLRPPEDGRWVSVATLAIDHEMTIEVRTAGADGFVTVDAVQVLPADK